MKKKSKRKSRRKLNGIQTKDNSLLKYIDSSQNHEIELINASKVFFAEQNLFDYKYNDQEQFARFAAIETICCNCKQLFLSKNKLHKHLKTKCLRTTRFVTRVSATAPSHALILVEVLIVPRSLHNAISIIESMALKIELDLGYAFCVIILVLILL